MTPNQAPWHNDSVPDFAPVVGEWTGDDVRTFRRALRLSQRGFAAASATNPRTIAGWEAGDPISDKSAIRLDEMLRDADVNVQRRFSALRSAPDAWVHGVASVESWAGLNGASDDWMVHLWVYAADAEHAYRVARDIGDKFADHIAVAQHMTTFAPVGHDRARQFVYCDMGICDLPGGHPGDCTPSRSASSTGNSTPPHYTSAPAAGGPSI